MFKDDSQINHHTIQCKYPVANDCTLKENGNTGCLPGGSGPGFLENSFRTTRTTDAVTKGSITHAQLIDRSYTSHTVYVRENKHVYVQTDGAVKTKISCTVFHSSQNAEPIEIPTAMFVITVSKPYPLKLMANGRCSRWQIFRGVLN